MKCIRNPVTGEIRRVSDYEARTKFTPYGWEYVSKGEWKRSVRPKLSGIRPAAAKVVAGMVAGAKPGLRRL